MSTFGATLKAIRERRRLSQSRLAARSGHDHSYVSRLETGTRHPTREAITLLVEALDATPGERDELLHAAGFATLDPSPEIEAFAALPVEWQRRALAFVKIALDAIDAEHREGKAA